MRADGTHRSPTPIWVVRVGQEGSLRPCLPRPARCVVQRHAGTARGAHLLRWGGQERRLRR
ncbi:hypothetical protein [Streptomyces olivaceoviridis]|uniref:hypothetical protein n=1 Tax=Streptomyces olivaceoviridis TaxID=1921 RepID=UPI00370307E3